MLTGGHGADLFVFTSVTDSLPGMADLITDFSGKSAYSVGRNGKSQLTGGEGDKIDLSAIDANVRTSGDQAFKVVKAFSGVPGQLYSSFDRTSATTSIFLDVNGDAVPDMIILLSGNHNLTPADFIL